MSDNEVPAPACTMLWAAQCSLQLLGKLKMVNHIIGKRMWKIYIILEANVSTSWCGFFLTLSYLLSGLMRNSFSCSLALTHNVAGIPWNLFLNLWIIIIAEIKHWCKLDLPFLRRWIKLNLLFLRLTSWSGFFYTSPLFKFQSDFWSEIKCCTIRCIK